jgi:hypothetical protein
MKPITAHAALTKVLKAIPNGGSKGMSESVISCFVKRYLLEKDGNIYRVPQGKAITREDLNEVIRELRGF